jgi:polyisoprenoid-binding protein YceI
MKTKLYSLFTLAGVATAALAAPQTFDFKDPKAVNNVTFKLVAPLESINGSASGISGTLTFDAGNPAATKGRIVVAAASLTVPNAMMKSHLHGATWLEVAKYPEITFEVKELKNAKTDGDKISAEAVGTFTLKGVSKELTVPVTLAYLKDKLSERLPDQKGDLLVVRAVFSIQRSDFNVNAHQNEDKVAEKIELTLGIAGASAK